MKKDIVIKVTENKNGKLSQAIDAIVKKEAEAKALKTKTK